MVVSMCHIVLNGVIYLVFLAASSPKSRAVGGAGGVSCNARNVSGNWRFDWDGGKLDKMHSITKTFAHHHLLSAYTQDFFLKSFK